MFIRWPWILTTKVNVCLAMRNWPLPNLKYTGFTCFGVSEDKYLELLTTDADKIDLVAPESKRIRIFLPSCNCARVRFLSLSWIRISFSSFGYSLTCSRWTGWPGGVLAGSSLIENFGPVGVAWREAGKKGACIGFADGGVSESSLWIYVQECCNKNTPLKMENECQTA